MSLFLIVLNNFKYTLFYSHTQNHFILTFTKTKSLVNGKKQTNEHQQLQKNSTQYNNMFVCFLNWTSFNLSTAFLERRVIRDAARDTSATVKHVRLHRKLWTGKTRSLWTAPNKGYFWSFGRTCLVHMCFFLQKVLSNHSHKYDWLILGFSTAEPDKNEVMYCSCSVTKTWNHADLWHSRFLMAL